MLPAASRHYAPSRVMQLTTAVGNATSRPPASEGSTSLDAGQVRTKPGGRRLLTVLSLKVSPAAAVLLPFVFGHPANPERYRACVIRPTPLQESPEAQGRRQSQFGPRRPGTGTGGHRASDG